MVIVQRFFWIWKRTDQVFWNCGLPVSLLSNDFSLYLFFEKKYSTCRTEGPQIVCRYVFACYFLNQYYLVSHLTKNHTILRNHTNHYKIKPLPYHTIWGPPVEITFIILFFCILTPNSSWNYYLVISGNSNGLWLNSLWFSAVFLKLF